MEWNLLVTTKLESAWKSWSCQLTRILLPFNITLNFCQDPTGHHLLFSVGVISYRKTVRTHGECVSYMLYDSSIFYSAFFMSSNSLMGFVLLHFYFIRRLILLQILNRLYFGCIWLSKRAFWVWKNLAILSFVDIGCTKPVPTAIWHSWKPLTNGGLVPKVIRIITSFLYISIHMIAMHIVLGIKVNRKYHCHQHFTTIHFLCQTY